MRMYYINNGAENGGPFTLDQLKTQQLTKATFVWYQGMNDWKPAHEIEELNSFFTVIPPPIKRTAPTPVLEQQKTAETILGLKKSHFFLALLLLLVLLTVLVLNIIQNNKRTETDLKNKQTELSNEKITLEQNERNEQQIQEEIRKRIELENNNLRRRDSINSRLSEIKSILIDKKNQLATLTKNLSDAEKFTFFRSESEKTEEISLIQNDIRNAKTEMIELQNESDGLFLQLETIH